MAGKGSARRPRFVPLAQLTEAWDRTFGYRQADDATTLRNAHTGHEVHAMTAHTPAPSDDGPEA